MSINFDLTKVSDTVLRQLLRHIDIDLDNLRAERREVVAEGIRRSGMNQMTFED